MKGILTKKCRNYLTTFYHLIWHQKWSMQVSDSFCVSAVYCRCITEVIGKPTSLYTIQRLHSLQSKQIVTPYHASDGRWLDN